MTFTGGIGTLEGQYLKITVPYRHPTEFTTAWFIHIISFLGYKSYCSNSECLGFDGKYVALEWQTATPFEERDFLSRTSEQMRFLYHSYSVIGY